MFNKKIQIIAKNFTGAKNIRPTLAGVYFKGDKIAATNSFKLIEVTLKELVEPGDVPHFNLDPKIIPKEEIDFIIPIKGILDTKVPRGETYEVLNNAYFSKVSEDNKSVGIFTNDLDIEKIHAIKTIDGKFPEYEKWFKQDPKKTIKFGIGVKEMKELCETYEKLGHRNLEISIQGPLDPVVIQGDETEEYSTRSIIMPLKV